MDCFKSELQHPLQQGSYASVALARVADSHYCQFVHVNQFTDFSIERVFIRLVLLMYLNKANCIRCSQFAKDRALLYAC